MANMEWPGRVGGYKLNQYALAIAGLEAELGTLAQNLTHHLLLALRLEADIDKARAGDFDRIDPSLVGRLTQQLGLQVFR